MAVGNRRILKIPVRPIGIWCLLLLVAATAFAAYQRHALVTDLEQESTILYGLASQRADQHDAHLTALSAVAVAAAGERNDLFLDVASTITRFYPRIDEVQLVPLDPSKPVVGTAPVDAETAGIVRAAAGASDGRIALLPRPGRPDHYIMVKRSPNNDAAIYGLMLSIDARKLIGEGGPFWSRAGVTLRLSLPDGAVLVGDPVFPEAVRFSRPLGSASQPLLLETGMAIGLSDLLPVLPTALLLAAVTLAWLATLATLRQRARTRAALELAASARSKRASPTPRGSTRLEKWRAAWRTN